MSLFRSSTAAISVATAAARAPAALVGRSIATSAIRYTDDPKVLDNDTHSGASVKADKHTKDPHQLQRETAHAANSGSSSGSKITASTNDQPTHSEDAVHAEKHDKDPKQLQKETSKKLHK